MNLKPAISINIKVIIIFLSLALLGAVAIYVQHGITKNILNNQIESSLVSNGHAQHNLLEEYLDGLQSDMRIIATTNTVEQVLDASSSAQSKLDLQSLLSQTAISHEEIISISVMNDQGVIMASSLDELVGSDQSTTDIFLKGRDAVFFSPLQRADNQEPVFGIAIPVVQNGIVKGIIHGNYNAVKLFQLLTSDEENHLGKEVFLVDENGLLISPVHGSTTGFLQQQIDLTSAQQCTGKNSDTHAHNYTQYTNFEGHPTIAVHHFLPETKWCLFYEVSESKLLGPIRQLTISALLTILIPLSSGISLFLFFRKTFVTPLINLRNSAQQIAKGNLEQRVPVNSQDEVGLLTESFNQMVTSIKERDQKIGVGLNQIKTEEARLHTAINSLQSGIVLADQGGKIILTNTTMKKILSSDSDMTTDKRLNDWFKYSELNKEVVGRGIALHPGTKEYQNNIYQIDITPVFTEGDNAKAIGTITLIEDVSQRVKLDKLKDDFFVMAAHELRTPLTAINGNAQILEKLYAPMLDQPNFSKSIDDIGSASARLIKIVNGFLDMSRLESGRIQLNYTDIVITNLISQTIQELENLATKKNLTLKLFSSIAANTSLYADHDRVKQVLVNLIGNAIKYTTEGGITVQLDKVIQNEQEYVKVIVQDTGTGILEKDYAKLFNKFEQTERNATLTHSGTGLGLYLSKLLIEAMGGSIFIEESVVGVGTKVAFLLPTGI